MPVVPYSDNTVCACTVVTVCLSVCYSFILKKYLQFRTEENIKTSPHLVAAHIRRCRLLWCAHLRSG